MIKITKVYVCDLCGVKAPEEEGLFWIQPWPDNKALSHRHICSICGYKIAGLAQNQSQQVYVLIIDPPPTRDDVFVFTDESAAKAVLAERNKHYDHGIIIPKKLIAGSENPVPRQPVTP